MFRPEPWDIVIIILAAMLLFGANRLPLAARSIGRAIREFRAAVTGTDENESTSEKDASQHHSS